MNSQLSKKITTVVHLILIKLIKIANNCTDQIG